MLGNPPSDNLAGRIASVRAAITQACHDAGRKADEVALIAVSKTVGPELIREAAAAGITDFGENRVQDATRKFSDPLCAGLRLHFIGQLQTNKARAALRIASAIQSIDRLNLIEALEKEGEKLKAAGGLPFGAPVSVLLQVNVAGEEQKAGCDPAGAPALVEAILGTRNLMLRGLMTIAPLVDDPELARPTFAGLRELRESLRVRYPEADLGTLSMGMTNDYRVAIAEGATVVRIGRAIFAGAG